MQNAAQLTEAFAIPGSLAFDGPFPDMPRVRVSTPACNAELYLQGAHLTHWQPAGQAPALFLSERSAFVPGKAIRGGIPVIFPWFGAPDTSPVHPPQGSVSHGYARIRPWTIRFAALAGEDLHLSLTLDGNDRLGASGFEALQLGIDFIMGHTLTVRLSVANAGDKNLLFEEALHAYLSVADIEQVSVEGLAGTDFLDKTEGFRRKTQSEDPLRFTAEIDRPYLGTTAPITLRDPLLKRRLTVAKSNSRTTVVWNPAANLAAKLPDLTPEAWRYFACIETANVAEDAVTLPPGTAHTMAMHLAVEPL